MLQTYVQNIATDRACIPFGGFQLPDNTVNKPRILSDRGCQKEHWAFGLAHYYSIAIDICVATCYLCLLLYMLTTDCVYNALAANESCKDAAY